MLQNLMLKIFEITELKEKQTTSTSVIKQQRFQTKRDCRWAVSFCLKDIKALLNRYNVNDNGSVVEAFFRHAVFKRCAVYIFAKA
jgi:hypothetical protein